MSMYEHLTIDEVVDELKAVRQHQKVFKTKEEELKKIILATGEITINTKTSTATIANRKKEVFNAEAFINKFTHDETFDKELVNSIVEEQVSLVLNNEKLTEAIENNLIPLEYVIPFNEVTYTKAITIK